MTAPHLYAVYTDTGHGRTELVGAFPDRGEADRWAATCARDFKRRYVVTEYALIAKDPAAFDPPANGQTTPAARRRLSQARASLQPRRATPSNVKLVTYRGKSASLAEHARDAGLDRAVVYARLRDGWTLEMALGTPARTYGAAG